MKRKVLPYAPYERFTVNVNKLESDGLIIVGVGRDEKKYLLEGNKWVDASKVRFPGFCDSTSRTEAINYFIICLGGTVYAFSGCYRLEEVIEFLNPPLNNLNHCFNLFLVGVVVGAIIMGILTTIIFC